MEIVEFAPEHQEAAVALVLAVQNDEFGLGISLTEQPDLADIFASYNAAGGMFWVALSDKGDVVGTIGVANLGEGVGALKKFFVRPDYRSRKVGLALYRALEAFCEKAGFAALILDTPSVAHDSHRFYERNGFARIAAEELPVPYTYPDRDSLLYLKQL